MAPDGQAGRARSLAHDQFGVELGFDGELALASKADGDSTTGTVYAFRRQADGELAAGGNVRGARRRRLLRGLGPHAGRDRRIGDDRGRRRGLGPRRI